MDVAETLSVQGAVHLPGAVSEIMGNLEHALHDTPCDRAGSRLSGIPGLETLLSAAGPIGRHVAPIIGEGCTPVRTVLFDKSAATNWSMAWHQDRTIVVRRRIEVDGYGPWTIKQGMHHVAPPFELLRGMVTARIHLDPVPEDNAPLIIALGSHRLGRIAEPEIPDVVDRCGMAICLAERGDLWLYATPILHASEAARRPGRRRVLQVDYAASTLPGGLEWLGV